MKNEENIDKYMDMLYMDRPISKKHPHMSIGDRAAQFAPFAALTGHGDAINETARLTDSRIDLDENAINELNEKYNYLKSKVLEQPYAAITFFKKDSLKAGGKYLTAEGNIAKILEREHVILFDNGIAINIDDIVKIEC